MLTENREHIFEGEMKPQLKLVYNYLLRMTGNVHDAEDLLQETTMLAIRKLDRYEPGTNARAWLLKLAYNLFVNAYRRRNRHPVAPLEAHEGRNGRPDRPSITLQDLTSGRLALVGIGDELLRGLGRLSHDQRSVVLMSDYFDFPDKDIAEVMDLKLNTVKSTLRRARLVVIDQVKDYARSEYGITHSRKV